MAYKSKTNYNTSVAGMRIAKKKPGRKKKRVAWNKGTRKRK